MDSGLAVKLARFGPFELDLASGELRKRGFRIRLQRNSFLVLRALVIHPGAVVSREELKAELWPEDTFVEFETSLNVTVRRLRETLGDSAQTPTYIETLPKIGYRFVAPVWLDPPPTTTKAALLQSLGTDQRDARERNGEHIEGEETSAPGVELLRSNENFSPARKKLLSSVPVLLRRLVAFGLVATASVLIGILIGRHSVQVHPAMAQASGDAITSRVLQMGQPRAEHADVVLTDGRVVLLGGVGSGYLKTASIFDPASDSFQAVHSSMRETRQAPAVRMRDGSVLIVGGYGGGLSDLKSAEVFDASRQQFRTTGSMHYERSGHSLSELGDGSVMVIGGAQLQDADGRWSPAALNTTEIYDPSSGRFRDGPTMEKGRTGHTATVLPLYGTILVAGGADGSHSFNDHPAFAEAELYSPQRGSFRALPKMAQRRAFHTATLLRDGKVLITGGYDVAGIPIPETSGAELFDLETETFRPVGKMNVARCQHTATLLKDGRVLVVGGNQGKLPDFPYNEMPKALDVIELYDPSTEHFTIAGHLKRARAGHSATLLEDGSVLIAGGIDGRLPLDSAEIIRVHTDAASVEAIPEPSAVERNLSLLFEYAGERTFKENIF